MVSIQIKGRRRFSTPKSHKVTWDSLCSFIRVKEPPAFPITFELVIEVTVPGGGRNNKILTYESVLREAKEWLLVTQPNISKLVSMADPPSVFSFGPKSNHWLVVFSRMYYGWIIGGNIYIKWSNKSTLFYW